MFYDTIVAPITGSQAAAVAVVRLSGPESWAIASRVFSKWPARPESHKAAYGTLATGDDGLALPFSHGRSYTGEESVEFSVHGSRASVRALVDRCIAEGARMAGPGEFTQRAFLNGRMDLTQAEGVRDTVEAETSAQLRAANSLRDGALYRSVRDIREELLKVLAAVEASVDFSEEIGELDAAAAMATLDSQIKAVDTLLATADTGRILREGYRIAIVGPPNAGKSSLLNALLGADRAIVTALPGTTRDALEEAADFDGVKVVLTDTAGLREAADPVEAIGVERSHAAARAADRVWYVYDASSGYHASDAAAVAAFNQPVTVIANKVDLLKAERPVGPAVSALTREGLSDLIATAAAQALDAPAGVPVIAARHQPPLDATREALENCRQTLAHRRPHDLLSVDLREALARLGEITGETAAEDMVERIFHDFCIGK